DRVRRAAPPLSGGLSLRSQATAHLRLPRLAEKSHGDLSDVRLWRPGHGAVVSESVSSRGQKARHGQILCALQEAGRSPARRYRSGHRARAGQGIHRPRRASVATDTTKAWEMKYHPTLSIGWDRGWM